MAPTLRSAQTTPSRSESSTNASLNPTPTRKSPTCSKCGRPRSGHPRSGCPYADSHPSAQRAKTPSPNTPNIVDALGSIYLGSPSHLPLEDTKAAIRDRRRSQPPPQRADTLLSLDSDSREIIEGLLGMTGNKKDQAQDADKVSNWQEGLLAAKSLQPKEERLRIRMPGAFNDPSPYSSQASLREAVIDREEDLCKVSSACIETTEMPSMDFGSHSQPLARSMSLEERDKFMAGLGQFSDAAVHVVSASDVHTLHASAVKIGFHARAVTSKDADDLRALLVLGREEKAVQRLYERLEVERTETGCASRRS